MASPPSTGYPSHVTLILNAIYLSGAQSSPDAQIRAEQPEFLSTVLKLLTPSLSGGVHNTATMYVLQTEIILTYYFFASNRGMEAIYHFRAATSIVFACGLHRIRSSRPHPGGSASSVQYQLNAPADSLEEGERINAFWQVLILDKCSSVTMAAPSAFSEDEATGTIVDSPWPMEVGAYLSVRENHIKLPRRWAASLTAIIRILCRLALAVLALFKRTCNPWDLRSVVSNTIWPPRRKQRYSTHMRMK